MAYAFFAVLGAIFIVFVAFGVSAFQIANSKKIYNQQTGKSTLTGLQWLYLSPLCVGFSAFLVAIALSLFVQFTPFKMQGTNGGTFAQIVLPMIVFSVGMLLTLLTFAITNWKLISNSIKEKSYFLADNKQASLGILAVSAITVLAIAGSVSGSTFLYASTKINNVVAANKEAKMLTDLMNSFDYVGSYQRKRGEDILHINKDKDDKYKLRLYVEQIEDGTGVIGKKINSQGCLLSPQISSNKSSIFFELSECDLDIKSIAFDIDSGVETLFLYVDTRPAGRLPKIK